MLPCRGLVVIVQPGGLGGGGADGGDRHVESSGECVDRGRARRPDQVPGRGEGIDGGPGQSAAAGDLAIGPASLAQPLLDQALQRVDRVLRRWRGVPGPLPGKTSPVIRRMRRHVHQPNPSSSAEIGRDSPALTDQRSYCTVMAVQYVRYQTYIRPWRISSKEALCPPHLP